MNKNQILKQLYYDPEQGFISSSKLFVKAHALDSDITRKDVRDFIDKQYTYQVNRNVKKPKDYNSIISPSVNNNWQIDIIIYDRYEFNKYKYILSVVDVYSRYAWTRALTNHTIPTIIKNLESIIGEAGTAPKNINSDNEFNKPEMHKFAEKHGITFHYSQPNEINKNAIVERFNRTITELLQKYRTATGNYKWYTYLPQLTKNYNNTIHSTMKATPANIYNKHNISRQVVKKIEPNFKVGDKVRIKKVKKVFGKNDEIKFSEHTYVIRKIDKNKIYLTNTSTGEDLKVYVKPYEVKLANEIQYFDQPEEDDKPIHKERVKEKKITRELKKEGVEPENYTSKLRSRKPASQLEDVRYGKLRY